MPLASPSRLGLEVAVGRCGAGPLQAGAGQDGLGFRLEAQEMMDEGTSQPCELVASLLSREQFQIFKEVVPANIQS